MLSQATGKMVEFISTIINQYNEGKSDAQKIQFVYAGTSLALTFVGKTSIVTRPTTSEILTIPHALIPKRKLEKKYGIYLLYGRKIGGKKNFAEMSLAHLEINDENLRDYLKNCEALKTELQVNHPHWPVMEAILRMQTYNYVRNLKKILVLMTNLMLLAPPDTGIEKFQLYIDLLKKQQSLLEAELRHSSNSLFLMKKFFNKYLLRLQNLINQKTMPVYMDNKLRTEILNVYPVIFCAISLPSAHHGELGFEAIRLAFTPNSNVEALKEKLIETGIHDQVTIYGYDAEISLPIETLSDEAETLFLNTQTVEDLSQLIQTKPHLIQAKHPVQKKLSHCLNNCLQQKCRNNLGMAAWLLKNAHHAALGNVQETFLKYAEYALGECLQSKSRLDNELAQLINNLVPKDYFECVNHYIYLKSILALRLNVSNSAVIFDYSNKYSYEVFDHLLAPKCVNREKFIFEYLILLQNLFIILNNERDQSIENIANIDMRLNFVKDKYVELLQELKNKRLEKQIYESELYHSLSLKQQRLNFHV